jgi:hypothetical protein
MMLEKAKRHEEQKLIEEEEAKKQAELDAVAEAEKLE